MWLFTKPDDKREPLVLVMGSRNEAKLRLMKIVHGHGLIGQWEMTRLNRSASKKLRTKFEVDTLYILNA